MKSPNLKCPICHKETRDQYMVTHECWSKAGLDFFDNLHLKCLEQHLGMKLTRKDFIAAPINEKVFRTMSYTCEQIAAALDYAVLKPTARIEDIKDGAAFCYKHKLASLCVASANVPIAVNRGCPVAAVIGFPHGNSSPIAKFHEAEEAMSNGAVELDVVLNFGRYLGGDLRIINQELTYLCACARVGGVKVKAILETCHYTIEQIIDASRRCIEAGVDWLKTSTGFGPGGATPMAVSTMIAAAKGTDVEVKASGGIKTYADVERYLDLGCTRLGASRYLELCDG